MDFRPQIQDLKTPEDIIKLVSALSEMADSLDVLYTTTAPNGNISARIGRIAIYNNGGTYEQWQNVDGALVWQRMQKFDGNIVSIASPVQGDVIYYNGTAWARLAVGTKGQGFTTGGASANPSWIGMTTHGDVEYHDGTSRQRLAPGTSGQFLKTQGAAANPVWAASSFVPTNIQVFTSTATWTKPAGISNVYVKVWGGGGGGGGTDTNNTTQGGGGGGGYSEGYTAVTVDVTVTVGAGGTGGTAGGGAGGNGAAGGTSSFAGTTTIQATGGAGGQGKDTGAAGGAGGTGSNGIVNISGIAGRSGQAAIIAVTSPNGVGGWSYSFSNYLQFALDGSAQAGSLYGCGGYGGAKTTVAASAGGAGAAGLVIVYY